MAGYGILLSIHSITRWAVLLVGVLGLGKFAYGWLGKQAWTQNDRIIGSLFVGLMGIQTLLGIVMIVWFTVAATFVRQQWEHAFTMIIAFGVTHLLFRFRKAEDDQLRFRNSFFTILAVFILVLLGITVIGGW